ncbi:MAG: ribonuclease HI family protein [Candidatus ainarchaeum sp.]|nr:ribonuclease HI family protein [Candidatus ainarchaeum sp.]
MASVARAITAYCDGASRGNPGEAALGVIIADSAGKTLLERRERIGKKTNNEAEYIAIARALELASAYSTGNVTVYSDSEVAVRQLKGEYKVKSKNLLPLVKAVMAREKKFEKVTYEHHPREARLAKRADALANEALGARGPLPR